MMVILVKMMMMILTITESTVIINVLSILIMIRMVGELWVIWVHLVIWTSDFSGLGDFPGSRFHFCQNKGAVLECLPNWLLCEMCGPA